MEIGLIGLGNMGRNLAKNLDDKNYKLHVYNRTYSKTESLIKNHPKIIPHKNIKDLISNIKTKKIIFIMLTAGNIIDQILDELSNFLNEEDVAIDLGNSYFKDTIRRTKNYKFNFVGAGISGGELGARHGGSIMVGCKEHVWKLLKKVFDDISTDSQISNMKCCERFGDDGAGHFVKMVHNGIEYCDMDIIAECFNILKNMKKDNKYISDLFLKWNDNDLKSYLLEIAGKILIKKENNEFLIDKVEDSAQQKGTGKACITEAVELNVPAITVVESTFSRVISSRKSVRDELSTKWFFESKESCDLSEEDIHNSIYLCRAISYVQGFNLLNIASDNYKWDKDLSKVCDVWSNGCILRGTFLKTMKEITSETKEDFELSETFAKIFNKNIYSLKNLVKYSTLKGIPIPTISSCYNYVLGMREKESNGNMIQCMRDCFGGHTVIFKGEKDPKHIEWLE
ncbi:6-phosphogluconate dehydrogenase, decarboxylating (gnd) [Vairimorpha necatrix]|uniref:6-phosphogluconate dehydrogenase, decarboxylating n=1 Tax=Vairimorpha necatrix TaxID=6039 RepID=A0AAX4JC47_9MICR